MGYIYILTSPSKKSYIGQTIQSIEKRFKHHQYTSSTCVAICNAIQKYGWENLEKDWYECPDEDLNFDEELLIRELGTLSPNGYNLKEGGGSKGSYSEESKQKMREAHTGEKNHWYGKTHTAKTKKMMGEKRLGKHHTEESKKKMSQAQKGTKHHFYGKKHTKDSIQKMKEAQLGDKHHKSKEVYQYDINGNFIMSFACSGEAARKLKMKSSSSIRNCICGLSKTAGGFKWSQYKL
ncbi:GIY-YIG catalytic domain-containing endonuclease [Paramecium bursaria Chlorella virus OR0704.2.2]|nr:GIY-YIG catalytic domain-containing endonuclease [Paramecium bursaria Chlorella virus CZ-2]AGE59109.1 GIY-YIG catalytic domain-containing endonuclease [Paramecium bursaria Chlorella virus OR0704.2.2]